MSALTDALFDVARSLYPQVELSPHARFAPMFELDKGEISSTAAIELARALRGDAIAIAQQFIDALAPRFKGSWKVVAGYIVISEVSSELLLQEARTIADLCKDKVRHPVRSVIALTPDSVTPLYARIRVLASSALHAALVTGFEGRCAVGFEPEAPQEVSSVREVVGLFRRAVERALAADKEIRRIGVAQHVIQASQGGGFVTAWTSHHYHEQLPKEIKKFFSDARREGRTFLRMPPDGWLLSRDRALSEILSPESIARVVRRLESEEGWSRWMMHMASSMPSGDLDPSVALYDECASPRWSAQVLQKRLEALVPEAYALSAQDSITHVGDYLTVDREMALRALFLPLLTARAVKDGEILGWMNTVERFVSRGHALLNAPHFRASLTKPPLLRENLQIIASLVFGITSILPVVTEDVCGSRRQSSNQRDPF